jgi:hypothetical protein
MGSLDIFTEPWDITPVILAAYAPYLIGGALLLLLLSR